MPQERKVVTCFLESESEILVLRRSDRVGSYRGRWAGVSGYIETTPDEQAITEISEETGLSEKDIEFTRKGEPLVVEDRELNVTWIVHPYLFHVKSRSKVAINWEHREAQWIKPQDIVNYETVPMLKEALSRLIALP